MKAPILIVGAPRAGSSMTAAFASACGAFGGNIPHLDEPRKCWYENAVIKTRFASHLRRLGIDPTTFSEEPKACDATHSAPWIEDWLVVEMMSQGLTEAMEWYVKSNRILYFWPEMARAFPEAKWLLVRRNPQLVAYSCVQTWYMKGRTTVEEWMALAKACDATMNDIQDSVSHSVDIWPTTKGDLAQTKAAFARFGLEWNEKAEQLRAGWPKTSSPRRQTNEFATGNRI